MGRSPPLDREFIMGHAELTNVLKPGPSLSYRARRKILSSLVCSGHAVKKCEDRPEQVAATSRSSTHSRVETVISATKYPSQSGPPHAAGCMT